ncbi:MAG: hypothetical protein SV422_12235 [Pseudomonadota bacterium]|nr:hypothetical protein [Pseudomonadota bacterium]
MPKLPFFLLFSCLVLAGCASQPEPEASTLTAPQRTGELRDFSGHWEKNFQLSDDFNTRFSLYAADVRRLIARMNQGNLEGLPTLGGRGLNVNAISGLARFVEELTRMPLLDIAQDDTTIEIERENDFTLRCAYADLQYVRSSNAFGNDLCGWNGERLQFRMELAGGLSIQHQFTLSPDASMLNVMTTVSTSDVSVPLVISNYYERFDPPAEEYNCMLTLTRQTVCNQRGTPR